MGEKRERACTPIGERSCPINRAIKYKERLKPVLWGEAPFPDGMEPVAACSAKRDPRRGIIMVRRCETESFLNEEGRPAEKYYSAFRGKLTELSENTFRGVMRDAYPRGYGVKSGIRERQIRCTPEEAVLLRRKLAEIRRIREQADETEE